MGGYGSGRSAERATVESGLSLDISHLLRQGLVVPKAHLSGVITWRYTRDGERAGSIGYEAYLTDPDEAWVRLHYNADGTPKDYRVLIRCTPCRYGGVRWWWICPLSGRKVARLHLPPGATVFAARQVYCLSYQSQRDSELDRSHARLTLLHKKLGGRYRHFEQPPPPRPKGMHGRTYQRLRAELAAVMDAHEHIFLEGAERLLKRSERCAAGSSGSTRRL